MAAERKTSEWAVTGWKLPQHFLGERRVRHRPAFRLGVLRSPAVALAKADVSVVQKKAWGTAARAGQKKAGAPRSSGLGENKTDWP